MKNFDQFIDVVKQQMQPEGRAQHLAGTLQELFACAPNDATLADIGTGWQVLARPREHEEAAIAHRRKICAELSAIAAQLTSEPGNLDVAVRTWQEWQAAFQKSTDPRLVAMAKTFSREIVELQSAR